MPRLSTRMKNIKHSRDTMPLPFLGLVDKPLCFGYFYSMNKLCEVCGNEFYIKPSHYNGRFCCSKKCQNIRMRGKQVKTNNPNWKGGAKFQVCAYCKKDFTPTNPYLKSMFLIKFMNRYESDRQNEKWHNSLIPEKSKPDAENDCWKIWFAHPNNSQCFNRSFYLSGQIRSTPIK